MAVRPACLQGEVAEGAGDKMEKGGNNATSRYIHKMKSCVHKLKCTRRELVGKGGGGGRDARKER